MLSIAHITASLSDKGSGVKTVVEQLSNEACEAGHRTCVFGFDEDGFEDWRGAAAQRFRLSGPAFLGYTPSMMSAVSKFSPNIIHAHGLWMLYACVALRQKKIHGTPYVVSPHGMLSKVALNIKPYRKKIAGALYQYRILNGANCIIATSEAELRSVRDAGIKCAVALIPLGLEDAIPVSGFDDYGQKNVLYIGRKLPLKGLENLVLAWKSFADDFPEWRLQLVGPDSSGYEGKLRLLIEEKEVPRVDLMPPVYGVERERVFLNSQISILPSTSENFALTVGESLIRGVPAISTKATPWSGLESEGCGLWVDGDKNSIAKALAEIMSMEPSERFEMGRRGRSWMHRDFRWSVVAEMHHLLYKWILKKADKPDFVDVI